MISNSVRLLVFCHKIGSRSLGSCPDPSSAGKCSKTSPLPGPNALVIDHPSFPILAGVVHVPSPRKGYDTWLTGKFTL